MLFGIGRMCFGFGIWGLVVVILLGVVLYWIGYFLLLVVVIFIVIVVGFWVVGCFIVDMVDKDCFEIVIDEVVG